MLQLLEVPEIAGLDVRRSLIRIPPEIDVPLTPRVQQLIDTPEFRRLAHISQLGLVSLVYPAAGHSRFEHSLGVYRLTLLLLKQLAHDERFSKIVQPEDAELLIAGALLHDLGHWPFCHPLEDIQLEDVPSHEMFAGSFLLEGEVGDVLREAWGLNPREVASLLNDAPTTRVSRILKSVLSGPIDIDKMDYLFRDSLHAGVPYGRHFDQGRLIGSLCLNAEGNGLAITEKGKTAAELLVFARYVMFSEVYWHHAVRAATAMLQRAFFLMRKHFDYEIIFRMREQEMVDFLRTTARSGPAERLIDGLFGSIRKLHKCVVQYSIMEQPDLYRMLAGRKFGFLFRCSERLTKRLGRELGRIVASDEIIIDAPPVEKEVEFLIDVYYPKEDRYRPLEEVSPVVRTLAREQFDDYVKRVRVFAHPEIAEALQRLESLPRLLLEAIRTVEEEASSS
jgi:HD superfamily phosphohydrolase